MGRLSRELRAAMGSRSQGEIGRLLGVHQTTVSRLLACDVYPGPRLVAALLRAWPHLGGAILEAYAERATGGTDSGPPGDGSGHRQQRNRSDPVRAPQEGEAAG